MENINIQSKTEQSKGHKSILITILPVLSMIVAILPGVLKQASGIDNARIGILTFVLSGGVTFYIRLNEDVILSRKNSKLIISIGYLASICLLLMVPSPETNCFWMLGGLLVMMLIDSKLGLFLHFNLTLIAGISLGLPLEIIFQILIVGIMMCFLANSLRQRSTVIYAVIIILSMNVTLSFAMNNFLFDSKVNIDYMNTLLSILAVLSAAFLLCFFYDKLNYQSQAELMAMDLHNGTIKAHTSSEISPIPPNHGLRTSYELLCDMDNELIQKMLQFSESLYKHSINIADLSCRAAKEIGADELLAKAGGLYHEVGKINGTNYIDEGLIIAEDYRFPNELKSILKEHNIKYEKPNSVEAAIVMLTDNAVSTIEYIQRSGDHKFSSDKIISNIFQMRMEKGTLDSCNLSLRDFKILKEFFQKEFRNDNKL